MRHLDEAIVASALSQVEVPAAIWRKNRIGELSEDDAYLLADVFAADFAAEATSGAWTVIPTTPSVLALAASMPERHGLRAHDAVQLATAVVARSVDDTMDRFGCADRSLKRGAEREGFVIFDPTDGS